MDGNTEHVKAEGKLPSWEHKGLLPTMEWGVGQGLQAFVSEISLFQLRGRASVVAKWLGRT